MNVLLIANNDIASSSSLGVAKKLMGEFHAFQKLGVKVYFLCLCNGDITLLFGNSKQLIREKEINGYLTNIKFFDIAPLICREKQIDLCYVRFPLTDWAFLRMLKKLSVISKVYVEIPTFPYDKENQKNRNLISQFNYQQDRINRKKWRKYVERIVTFSNDKAIFEVPCININNGIDVDSVKYVGDQLSYDGDIVLISVAVMRPAHGYDRVIEGLREYYSNGTVRRIVKYNVVGNGQELDRLKVLVEKYHLEDYVTFYGTQVGEDLDRIYLQSQIGISMLAGHRVGYSSISDLKSREYCAKGLPYITATRDNAFNDNCNFILTVPLNDSPIDIQDVINFFDEIRMHQEIHQFMREYSEENLTWESQLFKVISCVNDNIDERLYL